MALDFGEGYVTATDEGGEARPHETAQILRHGGKIDVFDEAVDDPDADFALGERPGLDGGGGEWITGGA